MDSIRILRQIVTLADTGSFRSAAGKLGITHSALSQSMKRLEEGYGVSLFTRRTGMVVPTAYGQLFVDAARDSLNRFETVEREIALMNSLESGRLVIGCEHSLMESVAAAALSRLINRFPKLRFHLLNRDWDEMEEDLRQKKIDLYVGLAPDRRASHLVFEELWMPPPVMVCAANHPLTQKPDRQFLDILDYPIIGGATPDWLIEIVRAAFPQAFPDLSTIRDRFLVTHDLSALPYLISHSKAIAITPYRNVWLELKAGLVTILNVPDYPYRQNVPGVIATLENRTLPPSAERFMFEVRQELAQFSAPT